MWTRRTKLAKRVRDTSATTGQQVLCDSQEVMNTPSHLEYGDWSIDPRPSQVFHASCLIGHYPYAGYNDDKLRCGQCGEWVPEDIEVISDLIYAGTISDLIYAGTW